jgi:hypothetical protein
LQVADPCVDGGPLQLLPQAPQFAGCVGSTHAPFEHASVVPPSGSQAIVQAPLTQTPLPMPASGLEHRIPQPLQLLGSVFVSTQAPEQTVSAEESQVIPASPSTTAWPPASPPSCSTTSGAVESTTTMIASSP